MCTKYSLIINNYDVSYKAYLEVFNALTDSCIALLEIVRCLITHCVSSYLLHLVITIHLIRNYTETSIMVFTLVKDYLNFLVLLVSVSVYLFYRQGSVKGNLNADSINQIFISKINTQNSVIASFSSKTVAFPLFQLQPCFSFHQQCLL